MHVYSPTTGKKYKPVVAVSQSVSISVKLWQVQVQTTYIYYMKVRWSQEIRIYIYIFISCDDLYSMDDGFSFFHPCIMQPSSLHALSVQTVYVFNLMFCGCGLHENICFFMIDHKKSWACFKKIRKNSINIERKKSCDSKKCELKTIQTSENVLQNWFQHYRI